QVPAPRPLPVPPAPETITTSGRRLPQVLFETSDQRVELRGYSSHRIRLTEIDAGAREQVHRVVAAARLQQREIAVDRVVPLPLVRRSDALHEPRGRREAGRVLIDVVRRAEEVRDACPRHAR